MSNQGLMNANGDGADNSCAELYSLWDEITRDLSTGYADGFDAPPEQTMRKDRLNEGLNLLQLEAQMAGSETTWTSDDSAPSRDETSKVGGNVGSKTEMLKRENHSHDESNNTELTDDRLRQIQSAERFNRSKASIDKFLTIIPTTHVRSKPPEEKNPLVIDQVGLTRQKLTSLTPSCKKKATEKTIVTPSCKKKATEKTIVTQSCRKKATEKTIVTPSCKEKATEKTIVTPSCKNKATEKTIVTPSCKKKATEKTIVIPSCKYNSTERTHPYHPFAEITRQK